MTYIFSNYTSDEEHILNDDYVYDSSKDFAYITNAFTSVDTTFLMQNTSQDILDNTLASPPPDDADSFIVHFSISESGTYSYTFIPSISAQVKMFDPNGTLLASSNSISGIQYKGKMYRGIYKVEVTYKGNKPNYTDKLVKSLIVDIPSLLEDIRLNQEKYVVSSLLEDFSVSIGKKPVSFKMKSVSVRASLGAKVIITGNMCLTVMGASFNVNLSDENALYIYTNNFKYMTGFDAVFTVSALLKNQDGRCNLFRFLGSGIKSAGLELHVDTKNNNYYIKGNICLRIAGGKSSDFSCTIGAKNGNWDSISVAADSLNKAILPQYQIYLQTINAYAENLSQGVTDATFGAKVGFSWGPKVTFDKGVELLGIKPGTSFSAVSLDFSGEWTTTGKVSGNVSVKALNGIIKGQGGFSINEEGISLNASVSLNLAGIVISGTASSSQAGLTVTVKSTQDVSLFYTSFFKELKKRGYDWDLSSSLSAELFLSYDKKVSNSFISIIGEGFNSKINYYYNLDTAFEKILTNKNILKTTAVTNASGSNASKNSIPYKTTAFIIDNTDAGKKVRFDIEYDGKDTELAWKLTDSKGTFYYNDYQSLYDNIEVAKINGGIEIIVSDAAAGNWQLDVYGDSTTVGNCIMYGYIDNTVAENIDLRFTSRKTQLSSNGKDYTNWLYFSVALDTEYTDNRYLLYQDDDSFGYDGTLLGTVAIGEDGLLRVEMPLAQQSGSKYYYLVVENDLAFSKSSNYSEEVVFEMTSADLSVDNLAVSRNIYNESSEYSLSWTIENTGSLMADTSISNVFLSYDMNYDSGDILLSVDTVKPLESGERYNDYCYFVLPEEYTGIPVYLGVYANASDSVNEQGRDYNNLTWIEFNSENAVASSNYGQLMTSQTWSQSGIWNKFFPKESASSLTRTIAGCGPIAVAQLLYSRKMIHSLSFSDNDKYSYGSIIIDSNSELLDYPSIEELNSRLANIKYDYSEDEIAAFVFGIAIKLHAKFGTNSTSVYNNEVLEALKGLGFSNFKTYNTISPEVEDLIKNNLSVGLPVLISLDSASSGHMVWIEDYDSVSDRYYLNFGWGGRSDAWYNLHRDIVAEESSYSIDSFFIIDTPEQEAGILPDESEITDLGVYTTSPISGLKSVVDDIRVDLSWDDKGSDKVYCIEYADNSSFENFKRILTTKNFCHISKLSLNQEYFWRVSVVNNGVQSCQYSEVNSFATDSFFKVQKLVLSGTVNSPIRTNKDLVIEEGCIINCDLSESSYSIFLEGPIAEFYHAGAISVSSENEADGVGGTLISTGIVSGRIETSGRSWSNAIWTYDGDLFLEEFSETSVLSVKAETYSAIGLHATYDIKTNLNGILVLWGKQASYGVLTNHGSIDLTTNGVIIALSGGNTVSLDAFETEARYLLKDNRYQSTLLLSVNFSSEITNGYAIIGNIKSDHVVIDSKTYILGDIDVDAGDDQIIVKTGAIIVGIIYTGEGNDSITLEKDSQIDNIVFDAGAKSLTISNGAVVKAWNSGSDSFISLNDVQLSTTLVLDSTVSTVLFSGDVYYNDSNTIGMSIDSIDLTSTESGTYDILSGSKYSFGSDLIKQKIYKITRGTETISIKVGESCIFQDGSSFRLFVDSLSDEQFLKIQFNAENTVPGQETDVEAPTLSDSFYAYPLDSSVVLSWHAATDNVGVIKYAYRFATDNESLMNAPVYYTTQLDVMLTDLEYGSYYWQFTALDKAGNQANWSEIQSFTLTNNGSDHLAGPIILSSTTAQTNQDIILTARFGPKSVKKEFSFDNEIWNDYLGDITISENCTVWFRSSDTDNHCSEIISYTVHNIDKTAPIKPAFSADITSPTYGVVTVTATFSEDTVKKEYSLDGLEWNTYTSAIVFRENGTVYFRGTDAVGNTSDIAFYNVTNIEKVVLPQPIASANITDSTNGSVTVTATFSEDIVKKEYSLDGKKWFAYTTAIVFRENGTVYFRGTDAAGNISDVTTYNVTNIEKAVLTKPVASANITSPTNGNVIVTAVFSEKTVRKEYSLDGINWKPYRKGVKFFDNGLVYFRGTDVHGNISDVTSYAVTNILSEIEDYNSGFKITSTNRAGRGTLFKDTTVDSGGDLYVSSGGICVDTTIKDGNLVVSSNGIANGIVVNSGGYLHVSSGGTALNIIENGGHVYIDDDAEVSFCANHLSSVFVTGWGKFSIDSGTTAVDIVLSQDVYLHISRGAVVQNARIAHCGEIIISSGGTASNSILDDYMGNITILSGGVADGCKINNLGGGGRLFLSSGGAAQNIVASSGAKLNIAVASDTYLQGTYDGSAFEMKDAFISDYTVQSSGGIIVFSGASADSINVSSGGSIVISSGGTATNVVASACAQIGIDVASETYIQGAYAGSSFEMKNASISDYTIQSGGRITVYSGGTAANTTVVSGDLYVSSGGTATNVVWTPCAGSVEFEEGAYVTFASQYSNVYYGSNNELLSHAQVIESVTLQNTRMYVMSGGTANNTTVVKLAAINIWSGGTANDTMISSGGTMIVRSDGETNSATVSGIGYDYNNIRYSSFLNVFSGGIANDTIVHEDGCLFVSSDGLANRTTVNSNGRMDVSGGMANSALIYSGGSINVFSGGMADAVAVNAYGWLFASSGGLVNNAAVNTDGRMTVLKGGEAVNTIVSSGGSMCVLSGGTATNIVASSGAYLKLTVAPDTYIQGTWDGRLFKLENASISDYTLDSNIEFDIASGAVANSITVAKDGCLYVSSGGTATSITAVKGAGLWFDVAPETYIKGTYNGNGFEMKNAFLSGYTVSNNGVIFISSGGTASKTTVNKYGSVEVIGGVANKTTLNADGWLHVYSGGIANNVKVNSWGGLFVSSGGTANSVTLEKGGEMDIESGGTVNNLIVNGNSWLIDFHQDAKLTGKVTFANGVSVWMSDESTLDFDITQTSAGAAARVNNLSCIDGNPVYTLTVTDSQMAGTYKLAKGASKFKKSIFVRNTSDEVIGKLRIGNTEQINGQNYTLTCSNGCLSLTVEASDNPMIVMADITETTNRDVTLTVEFTEDINYESLLYRVGGGNDWKTYDDGVTVADNTTVYFKYIDTDGKESGITGYDVKNIDKTPPDKPVVSVDMTRPTRHSVICSIEFSEDSAIREYSLDGISWFVCTDTVRLTENGTAYFRGTDAAGNISDASSCTVTNIDSTLRDDGSDDGWNDYLYNKKAVLKLNPRKDEFETNELDENVSEILLDAKDSVNVDGKHNFVGKYNEESVDEFDFAEISLSDAAKLIFCIDTTDAVKFVVYNLVEGTGKKTGTYTMKALQTSLFNNPGKGHTKGLLLSSGDYYISIQSTNVKKGGTAFYNIELDKNSVFYTNGDNSDDWNDLKYFGDDSDEYREIGMLDKSSDAILDGWVGFGDTVDYAQFTLDSAANISFLLESSDAVKFTISKLIRNKNGYALKSLQTTTLKKAGTTVTKGVLLDAGEYYIATHSTNAAKGGNADYNITVSEKTLFFDSADGGLNNALYDKKPKAFYAEDATHHFETTSIGGGARAVKLDSDPVGDTDYENFVGYQDAADYAKIELTTSGDLYFKLKASGNATFVVYEKTQDKKGNDTLKAIQTTKLTLEKGKTTVEKTTDLIADLAAGEYYVSMTAKSTKANASGSVFYNVTANLNPSVADALAMPETSDSLAMTDSLSFGRYDVDALAGASASSLADLNDKSSLQSLLA